MPSPNTFLFENHVVVSPDSRLLMVNVEDEYLIGDFAEDAASVDVYHRDWSVLRILRKRFESDVNVTVHETIFPEADGKYDLAFVEIPKGRDLARAMLLTALMALKPNGLLYSAGANKGGANTAQTDLKQVAPTNTITTKARHRLICTQRTDTITYPDEWGIPWQPQETVFTVNGLDYPLFTHSGVFSYEHLDSGTEYLLRYLDRFAGSQRILDAGCGVGIIGMVAQRELNPKKVVWADVDLLAVKCVRATLPDAPVVAADLTHDLLAEHTPFDLILCNPPFHQGHEQTTAFMVGFAKRARQMLVPSGKLVVVFNNFLQYWDILETNDFAVEFIADDGRFQILAGTPTGRGVNQTYELE